MKNSSDTFGNRTRDLPACSAVPQPTAPPAACSGLHVKFPLFLSDCNETCIFFVRFAINTQISTLIKIPPVEAEIFDAGDTQKLLI